MEADGILFFVQAVWNEMNKEYLENQAEKARQAEINAANGIFAPPSKRKRKAADGGGPAKTAAEATARMLKTKNLSNKVNYSALKDLFGEDDMPSEMGGMIAGGFNADDA